MNRKKLQKYRIQIRKAFYQQKFTSIRKQNQRSIQLQSMIEIFSNCQLKKQNLQSILQHLIHLNKLIVICSAEEYFGKKNVINFINGQEKQINFAIQRLLVNTNFRNNVTYFINTITEAQSYFKLNNQALNQQHNHILQKIKSQIFKILSEIYKYPTVLALSFPITKFLGFQNDEQYYLYIQRSFQIIDEIVYLLKSSSCSYNKNSRQILLRLNNCLNRIIDYFVQNSQLKQQTLQSLSKADNISFQLIFKLYNMLSDQNYEVYLANEIKSLMEQELNVSQQIANNKIILFTFLQSLSKYLDLIATINQQISVPYLRSNIVKFSKFVVKSTQTQNNQENLYLKSNLQLILIYEASQLFYSAINLFSFKEIVEFCISLVNVIINQADFSLNFYNHDYLKDIQNKPNYDQKVEQNSQTLLNVKKLSKQLHYLQLLGPLQFLLTQCNITFTTLINFDQNHSNSICYTIKNFINTISQSIINDLQYFCQEKQLFAKSFYSVLYQIFGQEKGQYINQFIDDLSKAVYSIQNNQQNHYIDKPHKINMNKGKTQMLLNLQFLLDQVNTNSSQRQIGIDN